MNEDSSEVTAAPTVPDDLIIIPSPAHPDLALVLGESPIPDRLGQVVAAAPDAALRTLQGLGAVAQTAALVGTGSGRWVQLTAESASQLARLGPTMDATGSHALGVLRGSSGGFEHVLQLQTVGVLDPTGASLIAGLAVQATLARIERQLASLADKVDVLLESEEIAVEAKIIAGLDAIRQVERRLAVTGIVDDDDWDTLASERSDIREAYHQVLRWLTPLRQLLVEEDVRVKPLVEALNKSVVLRDVATWIRLYVWAELALKRWELLYLIRQMTVSPETVPSEAAHLQSEASQRAQQLRSLLDDLSVFLDRDPDDVSWRDRARLVHRYRLGVLRREVAKVLNIYASALSEASVEVPDYLDPDGDVGTGPLLVVETVRARVGQGAARALNAGREAGTNVADVLADRTGRVRERVGDTIERTPWRRRARKADEAPSDGQDLPPGS